eukprot:3420102-Prymnesium_polylepis.2
MAASVHCRQRAVHRWPTSRRHRRTGALLRRTGTRNPALRAAAPGRSSVVRARPKESFPVCFLSATRRARRGEETSFLELPRWSNEWPT